MDSLGDRVLKLQEDQIQLEMQKENEELEQQEERLRAPRQNRAVVTEIEQSQSHHNNISITQYLSTEMEVRTSQQKLKPDYGGDANGELPLQLKLKPTIMSPHSSVDNSSNKRPDEGDNHTKLLGLTPQSEVIPAKVKKTKAPQQPRQQQNSAGIDTPQRSASRGQLSRDEYASSRSSNNGKSSQAASSTYPVMGADRLMQLSFAL